MKKKSLLMLASFIPTLFCMGGEDPGAIAKPIYLYYNKDYVSAEPLKNIASIEKAVIDHDLSYKEGFDYATALFYSASYAKASSAYVLAAGRTAEKNEKIVCLLLAAQTSALARDCRTAGQLSNYANLLEPDSKIIPGYRFAFWKKSGDAVEAAAAENAMKRLNVQLNGKEVCDPGTVAVVLILAVTAVTCYGMEKDILKGEDVTRILVELCRSFGTGAFPGMNETQPPAR